MTSCSSVLAMGMMPLLLYVYCQGFPGLVGVVPYGRIILALVMTIVPCSIGILITHYRPQWTRSASRVRTPPPPPSPDPLEPCIALILSLIL